MTDRSRIHQWGRKRRCASFLTFAAGKPWQAKHKQSVFTYLKTCLKRDFDCQETDGQRAAWALLGFQSFVHETFLLLVQPLLFKLHSFLFNAKKIMVLFSLWRKQSLSCNIPSDCGWLMLQCQHVNAFSSSSADGLIDGVFNREHNPRWVSQTRVLLLFWSLYLCFCAFVCAPKVNHWDEWVLCSPAAAFVNLTMTIQLCWW